MRRVASFFIPLAAVGLGLSAAVHLLSVFGRLGQPTTPWFLLHLGVFVVFIPAVLVQQRLSTGLNPQDRWKASLRGCPPWVPRALQVLGVYALLNFFRFLWVTHGRAPSPGGPPPDVLWGFSGHWMIFYAAAWAMLYSGERVMGMEEGERRCPNGHPVSPSVRYCEQCGNSVLDEGRGDRDSGRG